MRNAEYLAVREIPKEEAQRRYWTFYEAHQWLSDYVFKRPHQWARAGIKQLSGNIKAKVP